MRLHFGYSKNRNFGKAVLLSEQAEKHIIKGEGINQWHIVDFNESDNNQANLAANIYRLTARYVYPKFHGADIHLLYNCAINDGKYRKTTNYIYAPNGKLAERALHAITSEQNKSNADIAKELGKIINQINSDMEILKSFLEQAGYIQTRFGGKLISGTNKIKAVTPSEYTLIKNLIAKKNYDQAVKEYYKHFKDKIIKNDVFSNELVYLKREAGIQISGLELIAIHGISRNNRIVAKNREQFVKLVDEQIGLREKMALPTPLDILKDQLPTMAEMKKEREDNWHNQVYFSDGKIKRDKTKVTDKSFSVMYDKCLKGNIYNIFPDPVRKSEVIYMPESTRYWQLWTPIDPKTYANNVTTKGLRLGHIDCLHPSQKGYQLIRGDEINDYKNANQVTLSPVGGKDAVYTGRTHKIDVSTYYEINVIRDNVDKAEKTANVLMELFEEILRDAENKLRVTLGMPKIGEGWISEMEMFNLIKTRFPNAKHHARPKWLKPQHLDVFDEVHNLAFEYQGKQHYEPVDYFGGKTALSNTRKLDKRKQNLCKRNGIKLIYWDYNEPLTEALLDKKLKETVN